MQNLKGQLDTVRQSPLGPAATAGRASLWRLALPLGLLVGGVVCALLFLWIRAHPEPDPEPRTNELAAAGALQVFNAAAYEYLAFHQNGYPPSPAALGPPAPDDGEPSCRAAGILEATFLAEARMGYRFEYRPGPPIEDPPPGCIPGAQNYTFSARPVRYGRTGKVSYLTDETTAIYSTTQNRAATDRDPRFEP